MDAQTLLADPAAVRLDAVVSHSDAICLRVFAVQSRAACPLCKVSSQSLHSRYVRRVADLPWLGVAVRLELHTRKFRCRNSLCARRVFCERLPKVVAAYARRTNRLTDALLVLAFALGGEAGSRAAQSLQMSVSGDTLLNVIRQSTAPANNTIINVLGVDDWAKKKGQTYGTILVDLERRCPVDLLPDRESKTLASWLQKHPGIKTVSRDRSPIYAEAVRAGAPAATHVADRWHLLKNLREALENFLHRRHSALAAARQNVSIPIAKEPDSEQRQAKADSPRRERRAREQHQQQLAGEQRRAKQQQKEERFRQVKELNQKGYNILQTARALRMHRRTVRSFLKAEDTPTRKPAPPRHNEPFVSFKRISNGAGQKASGICADCTKKSKRRVFAEPNERCGSSRSIGVPFCPKTSARISPAQKRLALRVRGKRRGCSRAPNCKNISGSANSSANCAGKTKILTALGGSPMNFNN